MLQSSENGSKFSISTIEFEMGEKKIDLAYRYVDGGKLVAKTGIQYVFESDQDAASLGVSAARKIPKTERDKVRILIVVSQSNTRMLPGLSYEIHTQLGLSESCFCIDLMQGCAGFIHGLILASKLVKSDHHVLIICSDTYRSKIEPGDRSVDAIFSDAASAILVTADESVVVLGESHFTDGSGIKYLFQNLNSDGRRSFLRMSGGEVFLFTKRIVEDQIRSLLKKVSVEENDISLLIPHQASKLVLDNLATKFSTVGEFVNLVGETGNTTSSSIPIALRQHLDLFNKGTTVLSGFGVGLACSSIVLKALKNG